MGITDVEAAGGEFSATLRRRWAGGKAQLAAAHVWRWSRAAWKAVSSVGGMKHSKLAAVLGLALLGLALLLVTLELCIDNDMYSQLSSLKSSSSSPLLFDRFSGSGWPLVRLPSEARSRRMDAGSVLSPAFLHEDLNTSTIDLRYGEVRPYKPYGVGAHLYMHFSSYRNGPREFAVTGSIALAVDNMQNPDYACRWVDSNGTAVDASWVEKHIPEWKGRRLEFVYDPLVVFCHFDDDVGVHGQGGTLWLSFWKNDEYRREESLVALVEAPGDYKGPASFEPPFPYDVVYCGSPVYGNTSAERVREWLAYHMFTMGDRAHFILYDKGGYHEDVQRVLAPWVAAGRVTVQNIRQMNMYNSWMSHQRVVLNDCLFKSQFLANWTFFFDIDEYLYVEPVHGLTEFLNRQVADNITSFTFDQKPMSTSLCPSWPAVPNATRDALNAKMWGFEKFIFNMHWPEEPQYHKYAVQGRFTKFVEVHTSILKTGRRKGFQFKDHIWFHHYHGLVTEHGQGCRDYTNATAATWDNPIYYDNRKYSDHTVGNLATTWRDPYHANHTYSADYTIANLAEEVRRFEISKIGDVQPFIL